MADDDIPFDRSLPAKPDHVVQVSPLVRRVIANNGGPFTFTGTCTYLVGREDVTIIDPGPLDPRHRDSLLAALGAARVKTILVTHTHKDHAPGAASLKQLTGAPIVGCAPPHPARMASAAEAQALDAAHDRSYTPDTILGEGDTVEGPDYSLVAVGTPGHTMNHLAFALPQERALFSGDHVMAWSTTVIAPPDGTMRAYMQSLEKLQKRDDTIYWPGHGGPVHNPQRFVRALAHHRRQREHSILGRLATGDQTVDRLVRALYEGLAPALRNAAGRSVLAHLEDLMARGLACSDGEPGPGTRYRAASADQTPSP